MVNQFKIVPASAVRKKDLVRALNIYIKIVDSNTTTDTRQIQHYIANPKVDKEREVFCYVLYYNGEVSGFALLGYLHKRKVLMIDYICVDGKDPTLYFNFHTLIEEHITLELGRKVKYVLVELTTTTNKDGKLSDSFSNHTRKVLSYMNFKVIKGAYFHPSLDSDFGLPEIECNIAIKGNLTQISKEEFLQIVEDIYRYHYGAWAKKFQNEQEVDTYIDKLYARVKKELYAKNNMFQTDFLLVNCQIYDEGNCISVDTQNVTITRRRKGFLNRLYLILLIVMISIASILFTYIFHEQFAIISVVASISTIILAVLEIFRRIRFK